MITINETDEISVGFGRRNFCPPGIHTKIVNAKLETLLGSKPSFETIQFWVWIKRTICILSQS